MTITNDTRINRPVTDTITDDDYVSIVNDPADTAQTQLTSASTLRNYASGGAFVVKNAVADGVTDDTAVIQAAIDDCYAAGGGDVIIPPGDYGVTSLTRAWPGTTGSNATSVNIRGGGKTATILRKIGATTTPVLDLSAINVQQPNCVISDIEIIGNAKAHDGIRITLLARFTLQRIGIFSCDTALDNLGSQFVSVDDCTLTGNNDGYKVIQQIDDEFGSQIQPNSVIFHGGAIRSNSTYGIDISHGDLTSFYGTNIETNGVAANNATGAVIVRGTIDDKETYPTVEFSNCYFESNLGGRVIYAEASNLTLVLRNIHMFGAAADNNNISVDAIKLLHLENYSAYGTGAATTSNATSTIVSGGRLGTYTDNSDTTYVHSLNAAGPKLLDEEATSTNPTVIPNKAFTDTGLGWSTGSNLWMVCSGDGSALFENPANLTATQTSLWLYDDDNGSLQQVTVGAADSGGSGFKVLRIAN